MKSKLWITGFFVIVIAALGTIGVQVYRVDPFFHYHKPDTEAYYYVLDNQRSQNDGISKHFDYDALITGTSMTENFKTSEMDEIFGTQSIKVPYSGGSYKEINDNLQVALEYNPDLKIIVRGLDMLYFFDTSDYMRPDLGKYPTYLYDDNPINDVQYLANRDIVFSRVYSMMQTNSTEGFVPGITSFDAYSSWQARCVFGINTVCPNGLTINASGESVHLTESEKEVIRDNIDRNVTSTAANNPDVTFYYFITPYSIAWWKNLVDNGEIYRQIEAEQYIIELILEHDNIKLYSFNNRTDITTDLNNYKDNLHYGEWINSLMLKCMYEGQYMLTKDNYQDYLAQELSFYTSYDYGDLTGQEDYESDFYAAALLNQELSGVEPIDLMTEEQSLELVDSVVVTDQYDGMAGIECKGRLKRKSGSEEDGIFDYLLNEEYIGTKITVQSADKYKYLVFYGRKNADHGQPTVCVYNDQNICVAKLKMNYRELDNEWHQYVLDISNSTDELTIIFNGGYIDASGDAESSYTFSGMYLY